MALISSSVTKTKSICTPKLGPPFLRHFQELIGLFAKELYSTVLSVSLGYHAVVLRWDWGGWRGVYKRTVITFEGREQCSVF